MTRGSGGARRWPRICAICGETYILTNWMRRAIRVEGGWHHTDTHIMACERKKARGG